MIIYLAARYSRLKEMCEVRNGLVALGHVVTSRWITGSHEYSESTLAAMAHCASDDVEDLTAAECVISFTEPQDADERKEAEAILETYMHALGMGPLFEQQQAAE